MRSHTAGPLSTCSWHYIPGCSNLSHVMGLTCTQISMEINVDPSNNPKYWASRTYHGCSFSFSYHQLPITLPLLGQLRGICPFSDRMNLASAQVSVHSTSEPVGSLFCLDTSLSYLPGYCLMQGKLTRFCS